MADKLVAAPRVGGARTSTGGGSRTSNAAVGDYKGAPTATAFAAPFVEEGAGIKLSPATVLTASLGFIVIVVVLHIYGRLMG